MKTIIKTFAALALCVLPLLTGCSTFSGPVLTTTDVQVLVDAGVGEYAIQQIQKKPESRAKFQSAYVAISHLVSTDNWDLLAYATAINSTGILDDNTARWVVLGTPLLIMVDRWTGNSLTLSEYEFGKAVILGGQSGLARALSVGFRRNAAVDNAALELAVKHWNAQFKGLKPLTYE